MNKLFTIKNAIIAVLLAIAIGSLWTCAKREKEVKALKLENTQLDSIKNLYGQIIVTQQTEVTTSKTALKEATDSFFAYSRRQDKQIKDALAFYKGITKTLIRGINVPYVPDWDSAKKVWSKEVQANCQAVIDHYEANSIMVPKTARDSTKNYVLDFTATLQGINVNKIEIPDSQYIRFVTIKGGFLKKGFDGKRKLFLKRQIRTDVLHTNDSLHITGQTSAIYIEPKKANILGKAILIGLGTLLGTQLKN